MTQKTLHQLLEDSLMTSSFGIQAEQRINNLTGLRECSMCWPDSNDIFDEDIPN